MTGPAGSGARATEQTAADLGRSTIAHGAEGNGAVAGPLRAGAVEDSAIGFEQRGMFGVSGPGDTSGYGGLARAPWVPPAAEPPYGGYFDELLAALAANYPGFGSAVTKVVVDRGELTLHLARGHLLGIAAALRNDAGLRFELCSSVSGVDYYNPRDEGSNRLHSVYHLASMTYRRRIRLEVAVSVADPHIPSLTGLYPTADWQEREAFDMFGIIYDGHPALTRILMPDDWDGFPQRKDYSLGGISVQYKGANIPPPDERRVYQ